MRFRGCVAEDVVAALKRRGFTYRRRDAEGRLCFIGHLSVDSNLHSVELKVPATFDAAPSVRLTSPLLSTRVLAHLDPEGCLCYIAKGTLVFDWFNSVENTVACVNRAEVVLSDVLSGRLVDDLAHEFFSYWGQAGLCLYDVDQQATKFVGPTVKAFVYSSTKTVYALVTDDPSRSTVKLKMAGWRTDSDEVQIVIVKTAAQPYPVQGNWPPKTVDDVLTWQQQLDKRFARHLERQLLLAYARSKFRVALVVVESPQMPYSFLVEFDTPPGVKKQKSLLSALQKRPVSPLSVLRLDDSYITQRNLVSGKSLAGKRVILIGCGAVGGYLADMLIKAGAGLSGGKLTLVDNDYLGANNIGRHRLGLESLHKQKAEQLKAELLRSSPGAYIQSVVEDAKTIDLSAADLMIDATGEQALTEWLTWKYSGTLPILACWVEGPGAAVRALMKSKSEQGCSRCLSQKPKSQEYRVFVNPPEQTLRGHGCESLYVPFPASVSIQAAALAMEMVQAWVDGTGGPTLRSRALDLCRPVHFLDGVLSRTEGCPACSF